LGAVPLASHQIALNTASFTYMVPLGIGSAAAVRVGQALGRSDPRAASRAGWTALALAAGFMTSTAIAFWLVPQYIVRIYTSNPVVIKAASSLLSVAAFFQLFDGLQAVATGALRGLGDTRTPMIWIGVLYWLVGLPLGAYLGLRLGWGAKGLWIGLCVALVLIGCALVYTWHRRERLFLSGATPWSRRLEPPERPVVS
jgi:MATE family multidrug resistance protein